MSHHNYSRPERDHSESSKPSHHSESHSHSHHGSSFKHHDRTGLSQHPNGDGSLAAALFSPAQHNFWKELFSTHAPNAKDATQGSKGATPGDTKADTKSAHSGGVFGEIFDGIMSWYGKPQQMANGHQFDRNAYTVAHKTLPLGTKLDITANGKTIHNVEVTDRGPFVKGRTLDASYAIARDLGFIDAGTTDYKATVVSLGDNHVYASPSPHRQQHRHYHV